MILIKKIIEENYNIKVNKIFKGRRKNYFFIGNNKIFIKKIDKEELDKIDKYQKLSNYLFYKNKNIQTLILNNNGKYYFLYRNNHYALLLCNYIENNSVTLNEQICFDIIPNEFRKSKDLFMNIVEKWSETVDAIELEMMEYGKEYREVLDVINFYIGIAENAIKMYNDFYINDETLELSVNHKYTTFNQELFCDPFNLIITNRVYDMANYIKYKYFRNEIDYDEIKIIKNLLLTSEKYSFFACCMFPRKIFELIIDFSKENDEKKEEKIKEIKYLIRLRKKTIEFLRFIQDKVIEEEIIKWL